MRHEMPRAMTVICKALHEQIEHGLLSPGGRLPGERRLSELFATTRITLREALAQLEAQGLIYREERRGWFVSPPPLSYDLLSRDSFQARAVAQGREARTRLIHARSLPASAEICAKLRLPALSSVIQHCHTGAIDGRLVLYAEQYLNPALFPKGTGDDPGRFLAGFHASNRGELWIDMRSVALHGEACAALTVSAGSPALCISRLSLDRHGCPVACDLEYWRHDAIRIGAVISGIQDKDSPGRP